QDPLAELVKITPESIGVGQYQHDVDNSLLKKELKETVEFCVNKVGVNLNTASKELLSYVSGVSAKIAKNIIEYREKNGMFKSRKEIKKVTGLGPKAFEQAAGFMRISGENPLENTGVHPDHYYIVDNICKKLKLKIDEIVKKPDYLTEVNVEEFVDENAGKLTLIDIFEEIRKPGLDPREKFEIVSFDENVKEIDDVNPGQVLNGIITNITKFGAFCDIGVHQDGLIHISQIADKFIKDPSEVVSVGQWVKVKVVEVDKQRRRIALTMLI
ncbi:MAG: helix-hairpin-helix domain-containing protein, partial [Candidatus Muiribacteriota bacterium]